MYYLDSGGSFVAGEAFSVGSGSALALSFLDTLPYELRTDTEELKTMNLNDAIDRAVWAVRYATYRDGYSGGYINVFIVNSTGVYHIKRIDCRNLKIQL